MCTHAISALHDEVNIVAESYYDSVEGIDSKVFNKNPVFFVYLDYSEAMAEYFRQFQISSVPFFAFLPASTDLSLRVPSGATTGDIGNAEMLISVVSKKLKVASFPIRRPIMPVVTRFAGASLAIFLVGRYVVPAFMRNPFNPMIAFVVAMGVFFLSMAGLVFNLIRTPPFSGVHKDGRTEYIQGNSRSQYVVEGIIIASLMLIIAVAHIAINEVGTKRLPAWASRVSFYVSFAAYVLAANIVWRIFCMKYGFYPYNVWFNLPAPLQELIPF